MLMLTTFYGHGQFSSSLQRTRNNLTPGNKGEGLYIWRYKHCIGIFFVRSTVSLNALNGVVWVQAVLNSCFLKSIFTCFYILVNRTYYKGLRNGYTHAAITIWSTIIWGCRMLLFSVLLIP